MRLKHAAGIAAAAALTLSLAACGGPTPSTVVDPATADGPQVTTANFPAESTMARLQKQGTVTIGIKFDQPLLGLKHQGAAPEGFDVEIAKLVAAGLGVPANKINWVETPSKVRETVLQTKKVDLVVASYVINAKRRQVISFAGPYFIGGQDLMVRASNSKIDGPESLRATGAKVCTVSGSTSADHILPYIDKSQLVLVDVYSKCADALRTGQVDAVTTERAILLGLMSQSSGAFRVLDRAFTQEPWGIGIPKGDVVFCKFINDTLAKAAKDGSYAQAWAGTVGTVTIAWPTLPTPTPCT